MQMVSKAREDFPDPLKPVITTSLFLGMVKDRLRRLCSLAPLIVIYSMGMVVYKMNERGDGVFKLVQALSSGNSFFHLESTRSLISFVIVISFGQSWR